MSSLNESYDETFEELIERLHKMDIGSNDALTAAKVLEVYSRCRPQPEPVPEPEPEPVVKTRWEKVRDGIAAALDNETTRVAIKAGGAFAGVALVVWSTIQRDHVMERTALAQANQRNS